MIQLPLMSPPATFAAASHSRFVQRVRRRYAGELAPGCRPARPAPPAITALVQPAATSSGHDAVLPRCASRATLVIERLAVLDVEHGAALELTSPPP